VRTPGLLPIHLHNGGREDGIVPPFWISAGRRQVHHQHGERLILPKQGPSRQGNFGVHAWILQRNGVRSPDDRPFGNFILNASEWTKDRAASDLARSGEGGGGGETVQAWRKTLDCNRNRLRASTLKREEPESRRPH